METQHRTAVDTTGRSRHPRLCLDVASVRLAPAPFALTPRHQRRRRHRRFDTSIWIRRPLHAAARICWPQHRLDAPTRIRRPPIHLDAAGPDPLPIASPRRRRPRSADDDAGGRSGPDPPPARRRSEGQSGWRGSEGQRRRGSRRGEPGRERRPRTATNGGAGGQGGGRGAEGGDRRRGGGQRGSGWGC
ncbi:hypothetical protein PVAP13_5NG227643 [Panicum virgatum]|uniref:Uncharacterized protein n=1 Tax=Panicum virgatum TaxID=38727 RepID=A0A8T0RTF6_PANVG|nr:hypothetical protein PVAP13_5NG227643 [Panicum virgatum]